MKQIVMLQGMGNNEQGWARLVSGFGRVVLVQEGFIDHAEVWESGKRVYCGPQSSVVSTRFWDEMTFNTLTMWRSMKHCRTLTKGQKLDLMIAANYSMGLVALGLRATGKTARVVLTLSDYLPPRGKLGVRIHRRIAGFLTRWAARHADEVWTVSPRIPTAEVNPRHFTVPLCIDDDCVPAGHRDEIGYIGFPSPDHALDILFDIGRKHGFKINIIGDSPYLQSIKGAAPPGTNFHGISNDKVKIGAILSRCFCGYAVYRNTGPQSYSYYGIPSKVLQFFASSTPVVTTNTAHFTQTIGQFGVGRVVQPAPQQIEGAVLELKTGFAGYYEAINRFRAIWNSEAQQFHATRFAMLCGSNESPRGDSD